MALRCTRPDRLLALSAACRHYASSSVATLAHLSTHDNRLADPSDANVPSSRPNVQEYLKYVAENSNLTLVDLESFRPNSHSPIGSPQYEVEYQTLMDRLNRSFTHTQLRQFLELYGQTTSSKATKKTVTAAIIEKQWGWPSLGKSQRLARARKEKSSRVFALNPQQAFLLLGKDGIDILSLSQTYNVHLQFSRNPLSLTITGTTASIEELEKHIENLNQEIVFQDFVLPKDVDISASLQDLSRASTCFLESSKPGKVRIWYRESFSQSPRHAQRLISRFILENQTVPLGIGLINNDIHSPLTRSPSYALYPFFCESSSRQRTISGKFRMRQVGKWFADNDIVISENDTRCQTTHSYSAIMSNYDDIRKQLLAQVPDSENASSVTLTAIPGHIVFNSPGAEISLSPPVDGQKEISGMLTWVRTQTPQTEFIESAPMRLWQSPETNQRWIHRLVYETVPDSAVKSECIVVEHPLARPTDTLSEPLAPVEEQDASNPIILQGSIARLDVLLPDDARDLRLTLSTYCSLPAPQWPTVLIQYLKDESVSQVSHRGAPLSFTYEGKTYMLRDDFYIQSTKSDNSTVLAESERRFDTQSDESRMSYQVTCTDIMSEGSWNTFWNKCQRIVKDNTGEQSIQEFA